MSDVISDMKSNLNSWWKSNGPKVEDFLKTTAKKTEELTRKGKLKFDIFQAERHLEKSFAELGEYVFSKVRDEKTGELGEDNRILEFAEMIEKTEADLKELREEYLKVGKAEDLRHDQDEPAEEENPGT